MLLHLDLFDPRRRCGDSRTNSHILGPPLGGMRALRSPGRRVHHSGRPHMRHALGDARFRMNGRCILVAWSLDVLRRLRVLQHRLLPLGIRVGHLGGWREAEESAGGCRTGDVGVRVEGGGGLPIVGSRERAVVTGGSGAGVRLEDMRKRSGMGVCWGMGNLPS